MMDMEETLRQLFDFQRFEPNDRLTKLIQETENCYGKELTDEELFMVCAAGEEVFLPSEPKDS